MGGRASRSKGKRGEYLVRDHFRALGYNAERVPSSGAAQGFKGDVKVTDPKTGESFLVEVKFRQGNFKSIYEFLDQGIMTGSNAVFLNSENVLLAMSYSFWDIKDLEGKVFIEAVKSRTVAKIYNLQKLVKECQYLVIKDNNKPLIFLRFL